MSNSSSEARCSFHQTMLTFQRIPGIPYQSGLLQIRYYFLGIPMPWWDYSVSKDEQILVSFIRRFRTWLFRRLRWSVTSICRFRWCTWRSISLLNIYVRLLVCHISPLYGNMFFAPNVMSKATPDTNAAIESQLNHCVILV